MSNIHYQTLRSNYIENTRANLLQLETCLKRLPTDAELTLNPTQQGRLYLLKELKALISNRLEDLIHTPCGRVFTWTRYVNEIEDLKKQANIQIGHLNDGISPPTDSKIRESSPIDRSLKAEERFEERGIGIIPTLESPVSSSLPAAR